MNRSQEEATGFTPATSTEVNITGQASIPPTSTMTEPDRRLLVENEKNDKNKRQELVISSSTTGRGVEDVQTNSDIMTIREARRFAKKQHQGVENRKSRQEVASPPVSLVAPATKATEPTVRVRRRWQGDQQDDPSSGESLSDEGDEEDPDMVPGAFAFVASEGGASRQAKGRLTRAPSIRNEDENPSSNHLNHATITADVAEIVSPIERKRKRELYIALIVFLLFIIVAGALVGAIVATRRQGDRPPTEPAISSSATPAPTDLEVFECLLIVADPIVCYEDRGAQFLEKYENLLPFVNAFFPEHSKPVKEEDYYSPVHLAHIWLTEDQLPVLSLPRSLEYRFLLAYHYVFWSGPVSEYFGSFDQLFPTWLSDQSECEWEGISCNEMGMVVGLDTAGLLSRVLRDLSIPTAIGFLTDLRSLNLRSSGFHGEVPTSIGSLSNLERLNLGRNPALTGQFPFEEVISNLKKIKVLILNDAGAALDTSVPASIGGMANLEYLSISKTDSASNLPSEIGLLTNLVGLNARQSGLTGLLPSEIGNLANLTLLDLGLNYLEGTIPSQIGRLTNLEAVYLPENGLLSGRLPTEIGYLSMLKQLVLVGNSRISGTVPTELGLCTSLDTLVLENTFLEGNLPTQLGSLFNLEIISFSDSLLLEGQLLFEIELFPNLDCVDVYGTEILFEFLSGESCPTFTYRDNDNGCFSVESDCQFNTTNTCDERFFSCLDSTENAYISVSTETDLFFTL